MSKTFLLIILVWSSPPVWPRTTKVLIDFVQSEIDELDFFSLFKKEVFSLGANSIKLYSLVITHAKLLFLQLKCFLILLFFLISAPG